MRNLISKNKWLLAAVVLLIAAVAFAGEQQTVVNNRLPEPSVYAELQDSSDGTAYVIILLEEPPAMAQMAREKRREAVRQIQDGVLEGLVPDEFSVAYKYENFAAMTGRVNAAGLAKLAANPYVVAIGSDAIGHGHLDYSSPFINANDVQDFLGFTGDGITVAVLDTGIDSDHPDLSDNIAAGWYHFLDQGADKGTGAEDNHKSGGHGSNVAGIITSKGQVAPKGIAPDADILAIKVLGADCNGFVSDWAAGVDYVVSHKDDYDNLCIINMSLGTNDLYSQCPCDNVTEYTILLQKALQAAKDAGIVTFVSSGNNGSCAKMSSPACLSAATPVAAVYDQDLGREPDSGTYWCNFTKPNSFADCYDSDTFGDLITCFSNRNNCNELAAPGRNITAPGMGGGTSTFTGTSQASPHCAAVAALMCEKADSFFIALGPDGIVQIMKDTGAPTIDLCATSPNPIRVDALAAINANDFMPWTAQKWKQLPNTSGYGMDIACDRFDVPGPVVPRVVADDFQCTKTGPITKIIFWASWKGDTKVTVSNIHLGIYDDVPDPDGGGQGYSKPGNLLWERNFGVGQFMENLYYSIPLMTFPPKAWWWDPAGGYAAVSNDDKQTWRYDILIDPCDAFVQQGDPCEPKVYWLGIYVQFGGFIFGDPGFGWKTSSRAWNDSAVYSSDGGQTWNELRYPQSHPSSGLPINLAFKIFGRICDNCPDDDNSDNIDFLDYADFSGRWKWKGSSGGYNKSDLNCDGVVDFYDLLIFTQQWLCGCPYKF